MKYILYCSFVMMGFGASLLLPFVSINYVYAQSGSTPPCCVDRWDPGWTERGMWGPGMMGPGQRHRMVRHWTFMHAGIPLEYRGRRSTLESTPDVVKAGGVLYQKQCAQCHGPQGMGDGDAGKNLNPSPALLAYMIQTPLSVDEYLLWSISEGGKEFATDMPVFKDTLSQEEIWQIIAYMRSGFPEMESRQ